MEQYNQELLDKIKKSAPKGFMSCIKAHKVAEENNISLKELGEILNSLKIKLVNCQLGCF